VSYSINPTRIAMKSHVLYWARQGQKAYIRFGWVGMYTRHGSTKW